MASKLRTTKVLACYAGITALLGAAFVILVPHGRVAVLRTLFRGVCMSEDRMTISNLEGMEFKTIYTNCDTLAKDEEISVYVSKSATSRESLFTRWLNRKTLIFSYDPGRYDNPLPSIQATGNDRILITVLRVSSINLQNRKWRNVSINYDIGHIDYP
jgi:hypothetical protein